MEKIGIIGAGNIGYAIAKGLVNNGHKKHSQIYLSRKRKNLLADMKAAGFRVSDNTTIASECEFIILAVLPGQAREVVSEIGPSLKRGRKIIASVVAAVSIAELSSWIGGEVPVVRIMPNTAAEFGESMTCIAGEDEEVMKQVMELFEPLGNTIFIKEHLMTAATILGACGIAYFLRVIRAVSQGGIQIGFHADEAGKIAAQTARGAAELLLRTNHHPETEIDRVTTPMGCTIAGLNEMEHYGLSSSMIRGIIKSFSGISDLK